MTYTILVPINSNEANGITGGSGIVASSDDFLNQDKKMIKVYYEGNKNQACNLNTLYDRVLVAAGRMHVRYPTIAFSVVNKEDFMAVGIFVYDGFEMRINDSNLKVVNSWLSEDKREISVFRD
jgi:hypothetical protein